jgi:hypothetical protein
MRLFTGFILGALALLTYSTPASAWAIEMTTTYGGEGLDISDTVIVDVFLDSEVGLMLYSSAVIYDQAGEIVYDGPGSAALPPNPNCFPPLCGPGPSGAQPSYLLYSPPSAMMSQTILYPLQTPSWRNWPGILPPGFRQVNINYTEPTFTPTTIFGDGIYIGTLLFHVANLGDGSAVIDLCVDCGGNIVQPFMTPVPTSDIALIGGPVVVNLPEPAIASLALAGLTTVYLVRRRRRA